MEYSLKKLKITEAEKEMNKMAEEGWKVINITKVEIDHWDMSECNYYYDDEYMYDVILLITFEREKK